MIYLGLLLHLYQPWWQDKEIAQKIISECYRPLINLLNSHEKKCVTLNIQWSLIEKLKECKADDVIENIKKAVAKDRVELVSTAAYHPIVPLLSPKMSARQIKCDRDMKRMQGIKTNSFGLYLPEMAYDKTVISVLKKFGIKWTLTDDVPFDTKYKYVPFDKIPSQDGLAVFLRSNFWSNLIAMNKISWQEFENRFPREICNWTKNKDCYVILAMDGETFGHHHKGLIENFLKPLLNNFGFNNSGVKLMPIGEILSKFPKFQQEIPPGSWTTSPDDFKKQDYFSLWRSPQNLVHEIMWKISESAVSCLNKNIKHDLEVLKCQTSCQFWWVAGGRWNPDISLNDINHSMDIINKRGSDMQKNAAQQHLKELLRKFK